MRWTSGASIFSALLCLSACSDAPGPGNTGRDAALGAEDSQGILLDTGIRATDAGAEEDSGMSAGADANADQDAAPPDGGAAPSDAGAPDLGVARDAGAAADSGVLPVDAGAQPDASAAVDAGSPADAGQAAIDAGAAADAAVSQDAGVPAHCSPIVQDCGTGLACVIVTGPGGGYDWGCVTAGTQVSGVCTSASDCAAGYVCLNGASYGCLQICQYPNGRCQNGQPCQPLGNSGPLAVAGYCRSEP